MGDNPSGAATVDELAARWARALAAWAIPDPILAQAPESPWGWPASLFRRRPDQIDTVSRRRALEVLPPSGSMLDIGAGAGWASLPLIPPAARVVAVDRDAEMLAAFAAAAEAQGVDHVAAPGRGPEIASQVEMADLVVCHHVLYDVPDLVPFLDALTRHARQRVVVEISPAHPTAWLTPLWRHFWGLERPTEPTAADVVTVLRALGRDAQMTTCQAGEATR